MKGPSDAPPTPASTPPPVVPPEKESEIIEIDNVDEPTPALETEGQLILKCSLSVFKSQWQDQLILVSFYYFDAPRVPRGV